MSERGSKHRAVRRLPLAAGVAVFALAPLAAITQAEPASNVGRADIARATFEAFKVKTAPDSPIAMQLKSKTPADLVLRRHTYAVTGTTGWHEHPGPVFILVTKGTLTYYDYDDPDCTPHRLSEGKGFVDDGHGHLVRNESGAPAEDVSVIMAPAGATSVRDDLKRRTLDCGF